MACIKCKKPGKKAITHLGGSVCPACFSEIIEKRVRKSLRDKDWIKPKDKVLVINDKTVKAKVGIHILNSIFKNAPFNITIKKGTIASAARLAKGFDKVIIPWNADDEITQYLEALFNAKKIPKNKHIKLLIHVSDEEIDKFTKVNKIKGQKKAKSKLGKKIDELEKKYPGSKFGLLKSIEA